MSLGIYCFLYLLQLLLGKEIVQLTLQASQTQSMAQVQFYFYNQFPSNTIHLINTNIPIYEVSIHCDSKKLPKTYFSFNCKRSATFNFQTSYYKLDTVEFKFLINSEVYEINYNDFQIDIVNSTELYRPSTIDEGKKYYKFYQEQHLARNKSFSVNRPRDRICLRTLMRSGTHVFLHSYEEVTGEFFGTSYKVDRNFHDYYYESGGVKEDISSTRLVWTHEMLGKEFKVTKTIFLARDPIELADSLFHFMASGRIHHKKIEGKYYNEPIYKDYFMTCITVQNSSIYMSFKMSIPTFILRFEDMVLEPAESFKRALSFIENIPVHHTSWNAKIDEYFEKHQLSSFYRTNVSKEARGHSDKSKWDELFSRMDDEMKFKVKKDADHWMNVFGYKERFDYFMRTENPSKEMLKLKAFNYEGENYNKETLRKLLTYSTENYPPFMVEKNTANNGGVAFKKWKDFKYSLPEYFSGYVKKADAAPEKIKNSNQNKNKNENIPNSGNGPKKQSPQNNNDQKTEGNWWKNVFGQL